MVQYIHRQTSYFNFGEVTSPPPWSAPRSASDRILFYKEYGPVLYTCRSNSKQSWPGTRHSYVAELTVLNIWISNKRNLMFHSKKDEQGISIGHVTFGVYDTQSDLRAAQTSIRYSTSALSDQFRRRKNLIWKPAFSVKFNFGTGSLS